MSIIIESRSFRVLKRKREERERADARRKHIEPPKRENLPLLQAGRV